MRPSLNNCDITIWWSPNGGKVTHPGLIFFFHVGEGESQSWEIAGAFQNWTVMVEEAEKGSMGWGVRAEGCSHSLLQRPARNSWCRAWELHPWSSFSPPLPSCAEGQIWTPSWCRTGCAKPGNVPNAWLHTPHYICPTSALWDPCPLAGSRAEGLWATSLLQPHARERCPCSDS